MKVHMTSSYLYQELCKKLASNLEFLPDKPEETAESTLRALWLTAAETPVSAELAVITDLPILGQHAASALKDLVEKRISGVPLAHLTGRQRFLGIEMLAGPEALVPRKETELLARAAVDLASQIVDEQGCCTVVDVCTGSGNVALAVAFHVPGARVYAADLSEAAVSLARRNAHYLNLDERVEFRAGDLLSPFDTPDFIGRVDLLTCNPPYINSAKVAQLPGEIANHEPDIAFDGGPFGVSIMMRLVQEAPRFLRSGGWLAFEVGLGQGPALARRLAKNPSYCKLDMLNDDADAVRVILGRC